MSNVTEEKLQVYGTTIYIPSRPVGENRYILNWGTCADSVKSYDPLSIGIPNKKGYSPTNGDYMVFSSNNKSVQKEVRIYSNGKWSEWIPKETLVNVMDTLNEVQ